jgi:hypothetical protein
MATSYPHSYEHQCENIKQRCLLIFRICSYVKRHLSGYKKAGYFLWCKKRRKIFACLPALTQGEEISNVLFLALKYVNIYLGSGGAVLHSKGTTQKHLHA